VGGNPIKKKKGTGGSWIMGGQHQKTKGGKRREKGRWGEKGLAGGSATSSPVSFNPRTKNLIPRWGIGREGKEQI